MKRKILVDTYFYTAFKRNQQEAVLIIQEAELVGINVVVIGELLGGFRAGSKENINRRELDLFLDSPRVELFLVDDETAEYYAKVFDDLKRKGTPIPSNDMWIAASAIQHCLWLATKDEHFRSVDGLLLLLTEGGSNGDHNVNADTLTEFFRVSTSQESSLPACVFPGGLTSPTTHCVGTPRQSPTRKRVPGLPFSVAVLAR
jgi:tRNA(fMet)-specific endonuclease VapC